MQSIKDCPCLLDTQWGSGDVSSDITRTSQLLLLLATPIAAAVADLNPQGVPLLQCYGTNRAIHVGTVVITLQVRSPHQHLGQQPSLCNHQCAGPLLSVNYLSVLNNNIPQDTETYCHCPSSYLKLCTKELCALSRCALTTHCRLCRQWSHQSTSQHIDQHPNTLGHNFVTLYAAPYRTARPSSLMFISPTRTTPSTSARAPPPATSDCWLWQ